MNPSLRRFITSVPILRTAYYRARSLYNERRTLRTARMVFENVEDYARALTEERPNQRLDLRMHDGLQFTVRRNKRDAAILAEVFLDQEYTGGFRLPENPRSEEHTSELQSR